MKSIAGLMLSGLRKSAAVGGPFDRTMAAQVAAMDHMVALDEENRKKHFGHYLLNPFVPGPLSELSHRMIRRQAAALGGGAGNIALGAIPGVGGTISLMQGDPEARAAARKMAPKPKKD